MTVRVTARLAWLLPALALAGCPISETQDSAPEEQPVSKKHADHPRAPTGAVPADLVQRIKADLAATTGAAAHEINVQRAESVVFNDGSLGCPEPGRGYPQVLVNGFWVVLEHRGETYDYRASRRGSFKLCVDGLPPAHRDGDT